MPWFIAFLVCFWRGHVWGKVIRDGETGPFQLCERCGVSRNAAKETGRVMAQNSLFSQYPLASLLVKPRFLLFLILPVRWFAFLMAPFVEVDNGL
ncbi:MAG TPA: hypothetical protein PK530_11815 [Anaerolineales bacterium]|nr:hypothetical protein [Anaerolineales bacterium]